MKIIILEGIATSGKTTIKNLLEKYLQEQNQSYFIIDEEETLMPFLHNTDKDIAKQHLMKTILKYFKQKTDYLIFDRLYFTHLHRTNSEIKDFKEIENLIKNKKGKIIFLKIQEKSISKRIFDTMKIRDKKWGEYVKSKGNKKEIVKYYVNQQKKLLKHLKATSLDFEIFDTTKLDFNKISKKICQTLK